MNNNFTNPYQSGINTSATVLEYHDTGGQYANIRFDVSPNFDLKIKNSFSFKLYVPSSGITGNQTNQVSLKLQNNTLGEPWSTQTEIIKPIVLDQWQEVSFNFENDAYINFEPNSPAPVNRSDLNRVLIQINGENNTDAVLAYIDDFLYFDNAPTDPDPDYNKLVWSDEFDGDGAVDDSKWFHQTKLIAGDSWANNEQQHYTNREENSYVSDGTLKIVAKGETYTDQNVKKEYTSARLNSKYAFKYGRVEVRAKLPSIAGSWPAIWLLGKNINEDGGYWDNQGFGEVSWPFCGEIDIMEPNIEKTQILATWHWDSGSGYQYNSRSIPTSNNDTSQNFHVYSLVWTPNNMKIYMDDILINTLSTFPPFEQEFYFLLNVAMGGNLGGPIQPGFTQDMMEIDYIRVYQESPLSTLDFKKDSNIDIYPIPVDDVLTISLKKFNQQKGTLQVSDISGRLISNQEFTVLDTNEIKYSTTSLNKGVYFVTLSFKNGDSHAVKFVKK